MRTITFLLFLGLGCDESTDSKITDTGGNVDLGPQIPDGIYDVSEGQWLVTGREFTEDPCGVQDFVTRGRPGTLFDLVPSTEQQFRIEKDGDPDLCSLDGHEFDCARRDGIDTTPNDFDLDAVILLDLKTMGAFYDNGTMHMVTDVGMECSGPDCQRLYDLLGENLDCAIQTSTILEPYSG